MAKYKPPDARSWAQEKLQLANVFRMWEIADWSAEPNVIEARANSHYQTRAESAVTVRFVKGGREVVLTFDHWDHPPLNLKVIRLCVDDMRMIERRGVDQTMQSAYLQLAAPSGDPDPWAVMGLRPGATRGEIEAMFLMKARVAHPDTGGSTAAMSELNKARLALLEKVGA